MALNNEKRLSGSQWAEVEAVIAKTHRFFTPEQKAALAHAEDELYDSDGLPV